MNGHIGGEQDPELEPVLDVKSIIARGNQRPASMYETREGLRKPSTWNANVNQVLNNKFDQIKEFNIALKFLNLHCHDQVNIKFCSK